MFRKISFAAALIALLATLLIPAAAARAPQLSAALDGKSEVPGPGDPNGKGEIFVTVKKPNSQRSKVCFRLSIEKIDPPTAGHIHKGGPDVAGPIKVALFEDSAGLPVPGAFEGCLRVKRKLARSLAKNPKKFYVNIHNPEYPDGAIRGQLGPAL